MAYKSLKKWGYVSYDKKTGKRSTGQFPEPDMEYAGPLWLGELHDRAFIKKMRKLKRKYSADAMLKLMENEVGMPPFYYNVHSLCRVKRSGDIPNMDELIKKIRDSGYRAFRTHFSNVSIKTDAPYNVLMEVIG